MAKIQGEVYKVFRKDWPAKGRRPANTSYSIKLEGDDIYYRAGNKSWAGVAEPGNIVAFEASDIDDTSKKIEGDVVQVQKASGAAQSHAGVSGGDRNNSIVYQSSRKDAIEYVKLLTTLGAIKLPEKVANKLKALDELVDQITADFFNDVNTLGAVARASQEAGGEAGEPAAEASAATEEE